MIHSMNSRLIRTASICGIIFLSINYCNAESIDTLIHNMNDKGLRQASIREIKSIGQGSIQDLIDSMHKDNLNNDAKAAIHSLIGELGGSAYRGILEKCLLEDKDYKERQGAAIGLGLSNDPEAIKILKKALPDNEGNVKMCAVWGLAKLGDRSIIPIAIESLATPKYSDHELSIQSLEFLKATDAISKLKDNLSNSDPIIKVNSNLAIIRIKLLTIEENNIWDFLESNINTNDYKISRWIAEHLERDGSEKSIALLKKVAADKENKGSYAAEKMLSIYRTEHSNSD